MTRRKKTDPTTTEHSKIEATARARLYDEAGRDLEREAELIEERADDEHDRLLQLLARVEASGLRSAARKLRRSAKPTLPRGPYPDPPGVLPF